MFTPPVRRSESIAIGAAAFFALVAGVLLIQLRQAQNRLAAERLPLVPTATLFKEPAPEARVVKVPESSAPELPQAPAPESEAVSPSVVGLAAQVEQNLEKTRLRRSYADLLKLLWLSPAEEEQFFSLLAARTADDTSAEGAARDRQLRTLLKSHWSEFAAYERAMEERIYIMQCDDVMASRGEGLTSLQRNQLVSLMAREREKWGTSPPADSAAWQQRESAFQTHVLNAARTILKPGQIGSFTEALQQQFAAHQLAYELSTSQEASAPARQALPVPGQ